MYTAGQRSCWPIDREIGGRWGLNGGFYGGPKKVPRVLDRLVVILVKGSQTLQYSTPRREVAFFVKERLYLTMLSVRLSLPVDCSDKAKNCDLQLDRWNIKVDFNRF